MQLSRGVVAFIATVSAVTSAGITAAADTANGDAATDFVSSLILNVTQIDDVQKSVEYSSMQCVQPSNLTVDVGYAKYKGTHNATTGINTWKGSVELQ